nr:hypothetical protein [bacterium]
MRERLVRATAKFVVRHYIAVVILAAALAAISFPRASHLFTNIDTDLTKLLPSHYKSVEQIDRIRKLFKTSKALSVIVENEDPEKAKNFAVDLSSHLESDPSVSESEITKRGYEFFDKHKLMYIELDDLETIRERIDRRIQREKLGSLYIDFENEGSDDEFRFGDLDEKYRNKYSSGVRSEYNTNDSGTIYVMYVRPADWDGSIEASRDFYAHIKAAVESFAAERGDPSIRIHFSDSIRTHVEEYDTLINDLSRAGIISGAGIFLVLLLYFRRLFAAALIFAPL